MTKLSKTTEATGEVTLSMQGKHLKSVRLLQMPASTTVTADIQNEGIPAIGPNLFEDQIALESAIQWYRERNLYRVLELRIAFGFDVVFVPVAKGEKRPLVKGYPDFTAEKMQDEAYNHELEDSNIAILTGENSGNLISVDLDNDDVAEMFLKLNADLCDKTTRSCGVRGCNYWFRIKGDFPVGPTKLKDGNGDSIGELRAGRCITVVDGTHPEGVQYKREGGKVIECSFEEIVWPENWDLPWAGDPMDDIIAEEGVPFEVGERGRITLNEPAIVAMFTRQHLILHDPGLGFFEYDKTTGVWEIRTKAVVMNLFSQDMKSLADQSEQPTLQYKRTKTLLSSLTDQLAGLVEERDAFRKGKGRMIHVKNGMLNVNTDRVELKEFSPTYRSLGQIPFTYDPSASCPRFLNELLRHALPENDIRLLQKYAGQSLLGTNLSQTFLILEGEGGAGKGQIGVVIDQIIGTKNVAELRTSHLSGRFEMKSYLGKNLLAGRDVPGDFLNQKGAAAIKRLTGGDLMSVESKGKDERSEIYGEFNLIVTANTRLNVALEGDRSAWERRLLIIPFESEPVEKPIPNFGKTLVCEEGEGILAWMVEGAKLLLQELDEHGRIQLDSVQQNRISDLLAESDSVSAFVTRRIARLVGGAVHTRLLFEKYGDFCLTNDFPAIGRAAFDRRIRTEMSRAHQSVQSENIEIHGLRARGYLDVRVLGEYEEDVGLN